MRRQYFQHRQNGEKGKVTISVYYPGCSASDEAELGDLDSVEALCLLHELEEVADYCDETGSSVVTECGEGDTD